MQEEQIRELSQEMSTLMTDETFLPFVAFVNVVPKNYSEIIEKPIDLEMVKQNLENHKYSQYIEWYRDLELVFTNTVQYYSSFDKYSPYTPLAQYCLERIKDKFGFTYSSINEWLQAITKQMNEITEWLRRSPVPQGVDPMIPSIIKYSENKPEPNANAKAYMADYFNKVLDDPSIHKNVHYIIKTINPNLEFTDKLVIENLNEHTLCALYMYMETVRKASVNDLL